MFEKIVRKLFPRKRTTFIVGEAYRIKFEGHEVLIIMYEPGSFARYHLPPGAGFRIYSSKPPFPGPVGREAV
jgi:hypothetical protein